MIKSEEIDESDNFVAMVVYLLASLGIEGEEKQRDKERKREKERAKVKERKREIKK